MVELRARYLHREGRGAGVEAVEHVEGGEGAAVEVVAADQMTGARCAGRALDLDAKTSPDG